MICTTVRSGCSAVHAVFRVFPNLTERHLAHRPNRRARRSKRQSRCASRFTLVPLPPRPPVSALVREAGTFTRAICLEWRFFHRSEFRFKTPFFNICERAETHRLTSCCRSCCGYVRCVYDNDTVEPWFSRDVSIIVRKSKFPPRRRWHCFAREKSRSPDNTRVIRETHFSHRRQRVSLRYIFFLKNMMSNLKKLIAFRFRHEV